MKRGKPLGRGRPLERGEALKPDPEKVREWQQRSRARVNRRTGEPLDRYAPKKQPGSVRARIAAVDFTPARPASRLPCYPCGLAGVARRAAHWHHWLPQTLIRQRARGLARDVPIELLLADLKRTLADARNLTAMCFDCHMAHEDHPERWERSHVPASALEFAAELGPEWLARLERAYPVPAGSGNVAADGEPAVVAVDQQPARPPGDAHGENRTR